MKLRYGVLGPLEVRRASQPVVVGGPKQRLVLAILLIDANQLISIDRLVNEVWPVRAPSSAVANIRTYVSGIRAALRGRDGYSPLISCHGGYQLTVEPGLLDLAAYESLVETATAARSRGDSEAELVALERAAALWRGAPLEGVPDSPGVATFRVYLEEQRAALVEERARAMIDVGRHGQAAALLRRHVAEHPLRESGHYLLVLALHRSGATAAALSAYRIARETLVRELGVEPGPDLARLHRALLNGDTVADAMRSGQAGRLRVRPAQLPADAVDFVGREEYLAELDGCVAVGTRPVIAVITGMPGAGKTALAVHWAHRVAGRFPDGQLYINLRGYAADPPLEPVESLARFLRALGVPDEHLPHSLDERAALYRSLLAERRVLVLLDNAAGADQVRPLLPGAGSSMALVTSRSNLAGLVALDGAQQMELGPLPAQDSIALLVKVLGASRVQAEPEVAAELARLCGHLPLALRIAGAHLAGRPGRTLAAAAAALSADRLAHLEVTGDASAAVRASFDVSYRAQAPDVRRLFRLLGLVPGPDIATTSAAALVDASARDTARMMDSLASAHLVRQVAPDRFALHDLLGAYAVEQAEAEDDPAGRAEALNRLYEHYLATVGSAVGLLHPQVLRLPTSLSDTARAITFTREADAIAWLDAERDNLVAVVQRSAAHGPRWAAVRIADGLRAYFSMRMSIVDWSVAAEAALAAAQEDADVQGEAALHLSLAWLNVRQSKNAAAVEHGRKALECSQRSGWRTGEAAAYGLLGSAWQVAGKLATAAEHSRSALELNRDLGNVGGQAVQLSNLCVIHFQLGNLVESAEYVAESVALYRKVRSRAGEASALAKLGQCQHGLGALPLAEESLTEALTIARDVGDRIGETEALQALAALRCDTGETAAARELGVAAVTLAREIGHPRFEAGALNIVGAIERRDGRHRHSARSHRDALRLARDAGERYTEVEALVGLAEAHLGLGQCERALALAIQALTFARQAGYGILEGHALTALARVHLATSDRERALTGGQQALDVYRRTGHRLGQMHASAVLSEAGAPPAYVSPN